MNQRTDTVIVGAGIAGIAAAYYLARSKSRRNVLLVDRGPPMAYTTSKSGENFRAYWPQRCMADLCSRSHELMLQVARESGNPFKISETGYDFVSQQGNSDLFQGAQSDDKGVRASLTRITDRRLLAARFPYLSHETRQVVRIADAGSVDVHALGS
ncbi:MAG: FAD-binding oxidoreductase, partial [Xanthomonadales bacterium]|nr:FAD-binding oxidoreductase [Xanthomonadales bacterium]